MTEQELKAIVSTNVKRYRNYREWTQAKLAEKLNISINFLSDIENGKKWISAANIAKFSSILNIEPFELFKPAEASAPDVGALFSRYNNDVVQTVSESLNQTYRYYQSLIEEKSPAKKKDDKIPEKPDDINLYEAQQKTDHSSAAEAGAAERNK